MTLFKNKWKANGPWSKQVKDSKSTSAHIPSNNSRDWQRKAWDKDRITRSQGYLKPSKLMWASFTCFLSRCRKNLSSTINLSLDSTPLVTFRAISTSSCLRIEIGLKSIVPSLPFLLFFTLLKLSKESNKLLEKVMPISSLLFLQLSISTCLLNLKCQFLLLIKT